MTMALCKPASFSPFVVETSFPVRYAETDAMGVVHHSAYVIWLEEGRSAWFRQRLNDPRGYALMEADGFALVVTEMKLRFLAAARYGDTVRIRTWVTAVRSRTIHVSYFIENAETGDCLLKAESTHMCVGEQMQVTSIPDRWAKKLVA
jgi:acyl-CoA thioester hydrolase